MEIELKCKEDWLNYYKNVYYNNNFNENIVRSVCLQNLEKTKKYLGKWYKKLFPSTRGFIMAIIPTGGLVNTAYTGYSFASDCVLHFGLVERNASSEVVKEIIMEIIKGTLLTELIGESIPIIGSLLAAMSARDVMNEILKTTYERALNKHIQEYIPSIIF